MTESSDDESREAAPIPQNGKINPNRTDVVPEQPRKRRRARNRPAPDLELLAWAAKADARARARPLSPDIMLVPGKDGGEQWASPHRDLELWQLQLADAFGTRSVAVISTFLAQLQSLLGHGFWDEQANRWRYDQNEFSAIVAMVNSIRPRNEMETALAAQMVAVHLMQMKMSAQALTLGMDEKSVSLAGKLARTFAMQAQSLQSLRGKSKSTKQSIKVSKELHQHVHYYAPGGGEQISGQPHGTGAVAAEKRCSLQSSEQGGQSVRITSRKRKTHM